MKTSKPMPPSRTPAGRRKHYEAQRRVMNSGRVCPCGNIATKYRQGYACDTCIEIEENSRRLRAAGRGAHTNNNVHECAEVFTVHLNLS